MQKKLIFLGMMMMTAAMTMAQSMITISKDNRLTKAAKLNGKAGVIFMSKANDIVISSTVKKDAVADKAQKVGDHYEYEMILDISGGRDRVFNVSQRGTAISEKTGQTLLNANEYVYFNVEMVKNPITMETGNDGDSYIGSGNGWALIEFNSEIKLKVTYSPKLKAIFKSGKNKAGAYVDSLIVKLDSYQPMQERIKLLKEQYEKADAQIDVLIDKGATEEEIKKQENEAKRCEDAYNEGVALLNELTYISVKGEGTNERTIDPDDLLALNSKDKRRYNILVLSKKVEVFKTKYEEMIHQAESHKQSRDYKSAEQFFRSAAEESGVSAVNKQAALQSANKMAELAKFKQETDELSDRLYKITAENQRINKEELFNMIDNISERYKALNKETNDAFYLEEANRLQAEKSKVGTVFKGRFVMSEYKGGKLMETPISNVRIYGSQASVCEDMASISYPHKGETIMTVNTPDGRFSFTLQPGQYRSLIFEAVGNGNIKKNKYVSVENLTVDKNVKVRFPKE